MTRRSVCIILLISILKIVGARAQQFSPSFENFTQENGLSNNIVHCVFQDSKGWLWFGTSQGLDRFDGYKFTVFKNDPDYRSSLLGQLVRVIFEDSKKNLWVGMENGGLNRFNRQKETFEHYYVRWGTKKAYGYSVNSIAEDKKGLLWIGCDKGVQVFDPTSGKEIRQITLNPGAAASIYNYVHVLHFDKRGNLWIGTNAGLDLLNCKTNRVQHVSLPLNNRQTDEIHDIFEDTDGKLWIGTYNSGLIIVDPLTMQASNFVVDATNERCSTIRTVFRDRQGLYWIGSRGGLYVFNKNRNSINSIFHDDRELNSLGHNSILDIYQDVKGDIWLGTRGGISHYTREAQFFKHYRALPEQGRYLNDNEVYAFWIDPKGDIWVGTERGGINIFDRKTGTFRYLMHSDTNPNSISKNCIKAFMDDGTGNLWIGTFMGGIDVMNLQTGRLTHFSHNSEKASSLIDNRIWTLFRDSKGQIWTGTFKGLELFNPKTKNFIHYNHISGNQPIFWINEDRQHNLWIGGEADMVVYEPLSGKVKHFQERTRAFCQDSKGRIWIATIDKGLALYNKDKGSLKYYSEKDGIANNQVLCIQQDDDRMLWLSTANGLTRFNPETGACRLFDRLDGLQNNQFTYGSSLKTPNGEMLFGGISGFNIFSPREIKDNPYIPPLVFTGFRVFNQPVPVLDSRSAILKECISEAKTVKLLYDQNVITIEFASLNFTQPGKNRYKYRLRGFEEQWNDVGTQHSATYTNLNPGSYVFCLKASNNDNVWNEKGIELKINILPPFWLTWWFKLLVLMLLGAAVSVLVYLLVNKERLKHQLLFERLRTRKLHELDMMKFRFFTNISHEIRTPLTLIIGPLEKMLNQKLPENESRNMLEIMHRNTKQLLTLINQLLDYRKLEAGSLKLELKEGEIVSFVHDIALSFTSISAEKGIEFRVKLPESKIEVWFDADKLEKIINNLLTNAFKFTEKNGTVELCLDAVKDAQEETIEEGEAHTTVVELVVSDTGLGIPEKNIHKVFTRFFQGDNTQNQTGTGIGLALVKELVKLHNGYIYVSSEPGKGTKFTVRLPFETDAKVLPTSASYQDINEVATHAEDVEINTLDTDSRNILLIVEDNADVRYFIRSHFEIHYQVHEATDGKEGWQLALKLIPDIIISDVLMPVLNGKELCKKLKKDDRTSHIPVILLTALNSRNSEIEGLETGADDYITKPFDPVILETKVENLLSLRKSLREKYTSEMVLKPSNVTITSPDERFLQKVIDIIEKNIDDPDLDIERFAAAVGTSRMQLYRKISALTDMTVKEFIRNIRLKRAAQLLTQNVMTVSEVAYAVGFRDLSHFRKCFRQQYGMNASEYAGSRDRT
ncbi:MAG: two-component regulator propeller domain-containing protein [Bacteroidota bacterium]|nr:two-component regulator propeller domain-containing protein [Bacteroidota bacterium]